MFHAGMGIWVYVNAEGPVTLTLTGLPVDKPAIDYMRGDWNLVAPLYNVDPLDPASYASKYNFRAIFYREPTTGKWRIWMRGFAGNTLNKLAVGLAYYAR